MTIETTLTAASWTPSVEQMRQHMALAGVSLRGLPSPSWAQYIDRERWRRLWTGDEAGLAKYQKRVLGIERRLDAVLRRRSAP